MIIENKKYVIATKSFPLEFDDGSGNMVSDFNDAYLGGTYEERKTTLNECFCEPEEYRILEVKIIYEF